MKNNLLLAILALVVLNIVTSCKKEPPYDETLSNTSTSNQATNNAKMSAKINGTGWQATEESIQYNSLWRTIGYANCKTLDIQGKSTDGKTIYLSAHDLSTTYGHGIKIKTYTYEGNPSDNAKFSTGPGFDYIPTIGSIKITACDTVQLTVSGTFEFKAYNKSNTTDTLRVTNGVLNKVKYHVY